MIMETIITYANINLQTVTQQQTSLLPEYLKIFSVDGNTKKIEYYENGQLDSIEYYKANNESVSAIFSSLGTNTIGYHYIRIIQ